MKVLITDRVHPLLIEGLKSNNYEVDYDPSVTLLDLPNIISSYQGIVINSKIIMDKKMIDQGSDLRFISRLGSGMEIVDIPYAKSKDIAVISAPEGNCNAVGEHAMGLLLSLFNNLNRADREVRDFHWDREGNRGIELSGKTIGIVGLGHTGSNLGRKLLNWGVNVLGHDIHKGDVSDDLGHIKMVDKWEICKQCDVISFHLPLSDTTRHYVDKQYIDTCKTGVYFVNTSRGNVVNTQDLISGLKSGDVGGACLDVFENEKTITFTQSEMTMYKELYDMNNVILSPHVAGWTKESLEKIASVTLNKILASELLKKEMRV